MSKSSIDLLPPIQRWIDSESAIQSVVLFGSSVRSEGREAVADEWSDLDLHVVTTMPKRLENVQWEHATPELGFHLQATRSATGEVRKVTVLFASGQVDLVIVPAWKLRLARWGIQLGAQRKIPLLQVGLNEIKTCLNSGYRFLKGEQAWGDFYRMVLANASGVRMSNEEVRNRANIFVCDLLWIMQKLNRGELAAAQHLLHRSLAETNFALIRELRLRRGEPLPSFGLGRRVESLLPAHELAWVQLSANRHAGELCRAAWSAFSGLKCLMRELIPTWEIPISTENLLIVHRPAA